MSSAVFELCKEIGHLKTIGNPKSSKKWSMYTLLNMNKVEAEGLIPLEKFWEEIFSIVAISFRRKLTDRWFSEAVRHRMFNSDILSICFDERNSPIALNATDFIVFEGFKIAYSAMSATCPDVQRMGIRSALVSHLFSDCAFVSGRTQSPVVLKATARMFGFVNPIHGIDAESRRIARHIAQLHGSDMDDFFRCRNAYNGRALYDSPFDTGDEYSDFIKRSINTDAGDAIMFVARNPPAYFLQSAKNAARIGIPESAELEHA